MSPQNLRTLLLGILSFALFSHPHCAVATTAQAAEPKASAPSKPAPPNPKKERALQLTKSVYDIFEAKCVDCHGPELTKPKGKFGYVLDLERVAANPDYVEKGDAEASDIFVMVRDNEMPGENANVPALTPEEVDIVRQWINIGAPHELPVKPAKAVAKVEVKAPELPFIKRVFRLIGKFHAVSTHFPVALMMVAVLAEALGWWRRKEGWLDIVRFLVIIGGLSAIAAMSLGWINSFFQSYGVGPSAWVFNTHKWLGTASSIWALLCAVLALQKDLAEGTPARQQFRGALLVGAGLIGATGFLGSALIYGIDHYAW